MNNNDFINKYYQEKCINIYGDAFLAYIENNVNLDTYKDMKESIQRLIDNNIKKEIINYILGIKTTRDYACQYIDFIKKFNR